ncbi:MAG: hypothetical protein KBC02_03505 [Candidatus Pacebacteria bacterium]|nr:hypothetical protein [Candidatus Paceibacterota bacterium]
MTPIGMPLSTYTGDLLRVIPDTKHPDTSITQWDEKLAPHMALLDRWYDRGYIDWTREYYKLPIECLSECTFDELCKLYYSSVLMLDESVEKHFRDKPEFEIVRKIKSSLWRWGFGVGTWNQIVAAYDHIRAFAFSDDSDFEVLLDHSTYYNECGSAKYSRIFLDGVFAFLVHYRHQHVLTIGFSILDGRRILIQQVQAPKIKGNRALFRLPVNRVEHTIDLFARNFPGYELFLVDGVSLVAKNLRSYQEALRRVEQSSMSSLKENRVRELQEKIEHIQRDGKRIGAAYRDIGRHRFGRKVVTACGLSHRKVILRTSS